MVGDCPIEVAMLEVANTLVIDTITDTDVDTTWCKHSVDLCEHLSCIRSRAISAKNAIKGTLVDDGIECTILVLKLAHVHLFVDKGAVAVLVGLSHLLDHGERDVDVADVLVAILVHLLGKTYRQRVDKGKVMFIAFEYSTRDLDRNLVIYFCFRQTII